MAVKTRTRTKSTRTTGRKARMIYGFAPERTDGRAGQ